MAAAYSFPARRSMPARTWARSRRRSPADKKQYTRYCPRFSAPTKSCNDRMGLIHSRRRLKKERPAMAQAPQRTRFAAGPLTFIVRHELWDGNIQDHADQGVAIAVAADVAGRETTPLRFNCFDHEKSYVYGPENADLQIAAPTMLD